MEDGYLRRDEHEKLYLKLYEILKNKIERGEWSVGDQIPTESELCKQYEVSRVTVRNAISELVRQGFLRRIQGKGTFVSKKVISDEFSVVLNLKEIMMESGSFTTKVLAKTVIMPTEDLIDKLEVSANTHIIFIKRLCYFNQEPVILQYSYIPYYYCPRIMDEDLEKNFLIDIIDKVCKINITTIHNYIGIDSLQDDEIELLGSQSLPQAIMLEQFYYSYRRKVYYTKTLKKHDNIKLFVELILS